MKKTTTKKVQKLGLVRNVIRELNPSELDKTSGGAVSSTCRPNGPCNGATTICLNNTVNQLPWDPE